MRVRRGTTRLGAVLMAVALTAAACGDDDDEDTTPSATVDPEVTAPPAVDETASSDTDGPVTAVTEPAGTEPAGTEPAGTEPEGTAPEDGASEGGDPFGEPNPATGEPLRFGMLSQEAGPVTFPEVRAAAEAAAEYVNEYLGGISGRPIEISVCITDGQPSTSERCANQILDEDPVAIFGAIDTGASASLPVWERANLAFLGGLPLTPVENTSPQSVQFYQAAIGDNAAGAAYAATVLAAETVAVLYTDDPTGQSIANDTIIPTLEGVFETEGVDGSVRPIAVPPSAADLSASAAAAVAEDPDVIFVVIPNACANMHLALEAVGNEATIFTIGPCFDPRVLAAGGTSMVGVLHASPFLARDGSTPESRLFFAALDRWAEAGTPPNPLALGGFGTVVNVQAMLDGIPAEDLDTETILGAFRTGSDHPNFMAHPYTCDGNQLGPFIAACNPWEMIYEVQDDLEEIPVSDWISPGDYLG